MPEVLVRARGLTKRFGSFTAVDGIDFDLFHGEAFGFLGPDGAGKSSTMRMLGCVSPPTVGELTILGGDPALNGALNDSTFNIFGRLKFDKLYDAVLATPWDRGTWRSSPPT